MNYYHPVKIGNIELKGNIFLAPVAGYSDSAFRSVCVQNGACFTYTEMVSAEALVRKNQKTEVLMARACNEKAYSVQIFGGEEDVMAQAAQIVLEKTHCECIDINCGCPVPKIIKSGAGSALTRDPDRLYKITKAVKDSAGDVPVSVKIRSGWDKPGINWKETSQAALEAGVSAITIHPRTRAQGYEGHSDWGIMKALVEFVDKKVPVFGSGDLFKPEDARRMLEETGVDAVMFARGAMGNPFIFKDTTSLLTTGSYTPVPADVRVRTGFEELARLVSDTNEQHACLEMRKRFAAYSKGIENGAALRAQIVHAQTVDDYKKIFETVLNNCKQ
ncbi:MAG: tRNA dihydrouridine synthase DusB [Treponema sp.]|nr:tRNA dihydrouridine synthase DusB [Treponema sp.]